MKKVAALILAGFYFALTVGVSFSLHMCKSEVFLNVLHSEETPCSCALPAENACHTSTDTEGCCHVKEEPVSCCSDHELTIKLETKDQIQTNLLKLGEAQELVLMREDIIIAEAERNFEIPVELRQKPPPKHALYLTFNTFTFYG